MLPMYFDRFYWKTWNSIYCPTHRYILWNKRFSKAFNANPSRMGLDSNWIGTFWIETPRNVHKYYLNSIKHFLDILNSSQHLSERFGFQLECDYSRWFVAFFCVYYWTMTMLEYSIHANSRVFKLFGFNS